MFSQLGSIVAARNHDLAMQQHERAARLQYLDHLRRAEFVDKYPTLKVGPWTIPTRPILRKLPVTYHPLLGGDLRRQTYLDRRG